VSSNGAVTSCIDGGPILPVTDQDRALRAGAVKLRTVDIDGDSYRLLSMPWYGGGTL